MRKREREKQRQERGVRKEREKEKRENAKRERQKEYNSRYLFLCGVVKGSHALLVLCVDLRSVFDEEANASDGALGRGKMECSHSVAVKRMKKKREREK